MLVGYDTPKSDVDKKLTKCLLDLYKQESSMSSEQKANLNHKNRESRKAFQSIPSLEPGDGSRVP